jgi:hypothetical protein
MNWPTHANQKMIINGIDFIIIDDISQEQTIDPPKIPKGFYLQKINQVGTDKYRYRFCSYSGNNHYDENPQMIPAEDFDSLMAKAKNKGWL